MEQGGLVEVKNEVSAVAEIEIPGQVEELKSIGGNVRLVQQEGRVTEIRLHDLPPGEYAITMKRQTKTLRVGNGAATVSLAEFGITPQAHGAFMIEAPDGATDAVQW